MRNVYSQAIMSTASAVPLEYEPVGDVTPVRLRATTLESTAPEYLRDCKGELAEEGKAPVELAVDANFPEESAVAVQEEADRIRGLVRAASFLGANRLTVRLDGASVTADVERALAACAERARREGLTFTADGPAGIDP